MYSKRILASHLAKRTVFKRVRILLDVLNYFLTLNTTIVRRNE